MMGLVVNIELQRHYLVTNIKTWNIHFCLVCRVVDITFILLSHALEHVYMNKSAI